MKEGSEIVYKSCPIPLPGPGIPAGFVASGLLDPPLRMDRKPHRRRRRWIWILVPAVLFAGVPAIHYGLIVPARIKGNERAASAALKTLATANSDFRSNDRDGNRVNDFWTGDVSRLYPLIAREVADADAAPLHPRVPRPVPYHGYLFIALEYDNFDGLMHPYGTDTDCSGRKVRNNSRFGFAAFPAVYSRSGRMSFIVNESNTLFKRDYGGKRPDVWPLFEPSPSDYWR